ncbi:MAG: amino acid adenylation domain-containing protein [Gammaproteobacteria bacterium]|jgi:amino acid adenylation domain-containing protein/thioester reductase-like protein
MDSFSCYIVGDDYLLIECGKLLLQNGCVILGVLSSHEKAIEWANHQMISVFQNMGELQKNMSDVEFDYLFSISNSRILPSSILNKAKKFPINYHNALLPKYAGVYATTWAILNGEKEHGITWHVITEGIDEGDILLQEKIPIFIDDTMLTLNTRCHEKALVLFKKLVIQLKDNSIIFKKQKNKSRYYSLKDKVVNDGLINWNQPAEDIYRLYRALYSYPKINHIGLPVFLIKNEAFIPRSVSLANTSSSVNPGIIIDFTDDSIWISTTTVDIIVHEITYFDGREISIKELINKFSIKKGCKLPKFNKKLAQKLEQISKENYRNERYWVKQLNNYYPLRHNILPVCKNRSKLLDISYIHNLSSKTKNELQVLFTNSELDITKFLFGTFLIYLYRVNNYEPFTIGIGDNSLQTSMFDISVFYSSYTPYTVEFDPVDKTLKDVCLDISNNLIELSGKKSYKKDVFLRYPNLSKSKRYLPINIVIAKKEEDVNPQSNALTIIILEKQGKIIFVGKQINCFKSAFKKHMQNLSGHVNALTKSFLAFPEKPVTELSILTEEDYRHINNNFHGDILNTKNIELIHSFFEKQVEQFPDNIALSYNDITLTYSEFNRYANNIANFLLKNGVSKGSIIAISLKDTRMLVLSIFALMKIGAVYLPLDPNYPANQLAFMVEDSKADLLLTASDLLKSNSWYSGKSFCLDTEWGNIIQESSENLNCAVNREDIAYIIYTSGSTGKPKGVLVTHANIANSTQARVQQYNQYSSANKTNFLLLLSTSFDTSMAGILWPLLIGAKLTLLPPDEVKNIENIVSKIQQDKVTHIICVPALYSQILSTASHKQLGSLRVVILGGDYWSLDVVKKHKKVIPQSYLFNEYGVTEATIWSTVKLIYDAETCKYTDISIGHPIAGAQIYILDKYLQQVPIGVDGELFLGGANITRGYLNRPEYTAEKFITYVDAGHKKRLYKTGDVCNYSAIGGFNFKGRNDHQVKIRGIRIELPQIEKQLLQCPQVQQCVVVDREINNTKYVVAYFVPKNSDRSVDNFYVEKIKKFMRDNLPSYMVPAFFVTLKHIPLTNNSKIDRKLLPIPDIKKTSQTSEYTAPNTSTEKQLIKIWQKTLNIKEIGIKDNFFDLGGHSLLISQVLVDIDRKFKTNIGMQNFLSNPTICNLAKLIDGQKTSSDENDFEFIRDSVLNMRFNSEILGSKLPLKPSSVLLTGVTGFLGGYLLQDLYLYTDAEIYCLIRAKEHKDAVKRLEKLVEDNMLISAILRSDRIKIIVGDLSLPSLGLSKKIFNKLAKEIDFIYHNGAFVHHLYDYKTLRSANVCSVLEILKLATTSKLKKIHYISTFSTTAEFDVSGSIKEDFLTKPAQPKLLQGGYTRSKWVAEKLLAQAKTHGLPVNIYRPTWILGHSKTGVSPIEQNHLLKVIIGCTQIGFAPNWDAELNIMPVDFVSETIIKLSLDDVQNSRVFNVQNRNTLNWKKLIDCINRHYCPLHLLDAETWRQKHLTNIKKDNMLYSLLSFYLQKGTELPTIKIDIEDANVQNNLNRLNIVPISSNEKLFIKYFSYFERMNLLPKISNMSIKYHRESTNVIISTYRESTILESSHA